jgi:hypothetical protein
MSNDNRSGNETPKYIPDSDNTNTTKYICKVCGAAFDNGYNLDTHIT